jgi:hypothetical protein
MFTVDYNSPMKSQCSLAVFSSTYYSMLLQIYYRKHVNVIIFLRNDMIHVPVKLIISYLRHEINLQNFVWHILFIKCGENIHCYFLVD